MASVTFLAKFGYASLIVNFRGSLGYGCGPLMSLPGKV